MNMQACVQKFPSLSWLAEEPESALKGIRNLVADVVKETAESKEKLPEPLASKNG
mgnify:CR=1 FL=1